MLWLQGSHHVSLDMINVSTSGYAMAMCVQSLVNYTLYICRNVENGQYKGTLKCSIV